MHHRQVSYIDYLQLQIVLTARHCTIIRIDTWLPWLLDMVTELLTVGFTIAMIIRKFTPLIAGCDLSLGQSEFQWISLQLCLRFFSESRGQSSCGQVFLCMYEELSTGIRRGKYFSIYLNRCFNPCVSQCCRWIGCRSFITAAKLIYQVY